jgi:hypothetical protein
MNFIPDPFVIYDTITFKNASSFNFCLLIGYAHLAKHFDGKNTIYLVILSDKNLYLRLLI